MFKCYRGNGFLFLALLVSVCKYNKMHVGCDVITVVIMKRSILRGYNAVESFEKLTDVSEVHIASIFFNSFQSLPSASRWFLAGFVDPEYRGDKTLGIWYHFIKSVHVIINILAMKRLRSQWSRVRRQEPSSPTRALGSWFGIPLEAGMCVRVYSVCVVMCRERPCVGPIPRPRSPTDCV
jgi:hypothetical protein